MTDCSNYRVVANGVHGDFSIIEVDHRGNEVASLLTTQNMSVQAIVELVARDKEGR